MTSLPLAMPTLMAATGLSGFVDMSTRSRSAAPMRFTRSERGGSAASSCPTGGARARDGGGDAIVAMARFSIRPREAKAARRLAALRPPRLRRSVAQKLEAHFDTDNVEPLWHDLAEEQVDILTETWHAVPK